MKRVIVTVLGGLMVALIATVALIAWRVVA